MKISVKTQYGCLAVLELARQYGQETPLSIHEIATICGGLSERFLVQVLLTLKKAGIVASNRGSQGGYTLSYRPEYLTVGYIMALFESPTIEQEENPTGKTDGRNILNQIWNDAENRRQECLNSTTFADLVKRVQENDCFFYEI